MMARSVLLFCGLLAAVASAGKCSLIWRAAPYSRSPSRASSRAAAAASRRCRLASALARLLKLESSPAPACSAGNHIRQQPALPHAAAGIPSKPVALRLLPGAVCCLPPSI